MTGNVLLCLSINTNDVFAVIIRRIVDDDIETNLLNVKILILCELLNGIEVFLAPLLQSLAVRRRLCLIVRDGRCVLHCNAVIVIQTKLLAVPYEIGFYLFRIIRIIIGDKLLFRLVG